MKQGPMPNGNDGLAEICSGLMRPIVDEAEPSLSPAMLDIRPFSADDADWLIDVHQHLYRRDEGFDERFGELVAKAVHSFVRDHDPASERAWLAWYQQRRAGSIFCTRSQRPDTARLRLFLLLPELRGTGMGRQLLEHCLAQARLLGYRRMMLSTYDSHTAACRLYERSGFRCTRSEPVQAYGRAMREMDWERDL